MSGVVSYSWEVCSLLIPSLFMPLELIELETEFVYGLKLFIYLFIINLFGWVTFTIQK